MFVLRTLVRKLSYGSASGPDYLPCMTRLQELENQAGQLRESERAALVSRLLATLLPILACADGDVAEARRRDAELDADFSAGLTDKQFRAAIAASRDC